MYSQRKEKAFELVIPQVKVENSLYSYFEFLDSRNNVDDLGYVQTGMMNSLTFMIDKTPLFDQVDSLFCSVVDTTKAGENTILIQLRNMYFSEVTKSMSEIGYCHVRLSLYEKEGEEYYFINTLDTLVKVKAMDVTGKILKEGSNAFTTFIMEHLDKTRTDDYPFMMTDIRNIDYYEKDNLKLYSSEVLLDGIYYDYHSFANQEPADLKIETKLDKGFNLTEIKVIDPVNGKKKKVKSKDIYAVVIDGRPYIGTNNSYIFLYKQGDEFRFINDGSVRVDIGTSMGVSIGASIVSGLLGGSGMVMIHSKVEKVIMTIDYLSGEFVVLPPEEEV